MADQVPPFIPGDLNLSNRIKSAWLNDVNNLRYQSGDATRGAALLTMVQAGTGAVARTVQDKERDAVNALDFANANNLQIVGDDITDDNVGLQRFLNRGGKLVLGGGKTYRNLAANLTLVANTELWIERGTTLHLDTTRLTALNVNDVQIHNHGIIKSTGLNTTDALPTNWVGRGIVEFGGTTASPALRVGIDGPGEIFGDFVGTPGVASPGGVALGPNDRRRGIAFNNVQKASARFNYIHGTIAEAIWLAGTTVDYDVDIDFNRIYDCNHDSISAQGFVVTTFRTRGNFGQNCLNGIESSVGDHRKNMMVSMIGSGYGMGGSSASDSASPLTWSDNVGLNNGTSDFDLEGSGSAGGVVIVENNSSYGAGAFAFFISFAKTAIVTGNKAYSWGASATGSGLAIANCTNYVCDGNVLANENVAHSNGGFNVQATGGTWGGGNVTFGVALPFVSAFGVQPLGQILRTSIPTTVTGASYTVLATDSDIIANRAGTVTLTFESAPNIPGKRLVIRTIQAQTVASASANVVPRVGGAAGTAILAAAAGNWAELKSDGTNWQIMAGS